MPKIIKDLNNTIFNISMKLFSENGYEKVDMKLIAKKCNIAVGTLYNYYPNKKELYICILNKSWNEIFKKLEDIKTSSYEPKEKIRKALVTLYENIESRQGIAKELVNNNINDLTKDPRILEFKERLTKNIEVSLAPIEKKTNFKNDVGINRRLSETLLLSIPILIESHKEEKDDNIEFLNGLLEAFIK